MRLEKLVCLDLNCEIKLDRFESTNLSSLEELYLSLDGTATKHSFNGLNCLKILSLECSQIEQDCLMRLDELVCLDLNCAQNFICKEIETLMNLEFLRIHLVNKEEMEHFETLRLPKLKCLHLETTGKVPNLEHVQLDYLKVEINLELKKIEIAELVSSINQPGLVALVLHIKEIFRFLLRKECIKSFAQLVHFEIFDTKRNDDRDVEIGDEIFLSQKNFYPYLIHSSKIYFEEDMNFKMLVTLILI
jgi:hypothetical protein